MSQPSSPARSCVEPTRWTGALGKRTAYILLLLTYIREEEAQVNIHPELFGRMFQKFQKHLRLEGVDISALGFSNKSWLSVLKFARSKQLLTKRERRLRFEWGFCKWARERVEVALSIQEISAAREAARRTCEEIYKPVAMN